MGKKLAAFFLSFLMILSTAPISAAATAKTDEITPKNPFAVQDGARDKSIQLSKTLGHPQKSHGEKKDPKRYKEEKELKNPGIDSKTTYNVKFNDSSSLEDIYNCVSKYTYQLLGDSSSRLFKITISNLKNFKSKYSKLIEEVTSDTAIQLYADPDDIYYRGQWPLSDIKMPQAWDLTKGSATVKVAVIDSGFDRTHEDFTNTQILNGCDITDNNAPVMEDAVGHGTEVISVIAAETNNAKGISGAGWNVSVVPYKVADEYGDVYGSSIISAITMAADAGCDVISMSLGSYTYDGAMKAAIDYANSKGCIVIAAAGNEGAAGNAQAGSLSYPASYNGVVSVASVGKNNNRSFFSQYNNMVDVTAPGEDILVAEPYSLTGYALSSGTSFSAPYVASVAALAKSTNQNMTGKDFQRLIEVSSTDLGASHRDDYYGWGLLSASALLNAAKCPLVYGVDDNCTYKTSISITYNRGTATLNGSAFASGSTVGVNGIYVLAVTDASGNRTTVHFAIDRSAPVVSGVANGKSYNTDRVITFNEGAATLNGQPFASGDTVSDEDSYTLVATDSTGNSTSLSFTIDKTPPAISGVEDGATYHSSVMVSWNEGTATLNGQSVATNSTVGNVGSYTLAVADLAGNTSTVGFTISDLPTIQSATLPSALTKWVVDDSTGEVYALSGSNLLFINPDTLQIDSTVALPAAPTDLLLDSGKLYIALDSISQIQVVDVASGTTDKTLTTTKDPYRIVKDGENLFYTQLDQWCEVHKYNLGTDKDSNIGGEYYQPALAVNPALHILYIGESGSSGSALYYYDENLLTFIECSYDSGYGFSYPSRNIYFDGTSLYYAGRVFAPDNPNQYSSSFMGSTVVLTVTNGCIITGSGTICDRNAYRQIGAFSNTITLAQAVGDSLLYYNNSTKTISRAMCNASIGTDTIVGMLAGTNMVPVPKPGDLIQVNANTQKMLINSSLSAWVADDDNQMLYAISPSSNSLYFINELSMNVESILPLPASPTDIQLSGGKIYVALDDANQIAVIDPATKQIENTIGTVTDPYRIAIDGNNLFYAQLDQWCQVRKYDLVSKTDTNICTSSSQGTIGKFYEPDLTVNPSLHILYIGEANLSGSDLYYYDETLKTFSKSSYDDGYGFPYPSRSISFDGAYVYYANYALDPQAPKIIGDFTSPGKGSFLLANGSVIATTSNSGNAFYDPDTFAKIGTVTKNYSLLAVAGDKIFAYDSVSKSLKAIQSATGSVDSGNIVSLLHGTQIPPRVPTPGQKVDSATYSLAMATPLSNWVLDEDSQTLIAMSSAEKALLFINSQSMDLEKVTYLKAIPTDMIADDGKLYVAFDVCNRIDVFDITSQEQVDSISSAKDPFHIIKDGDDIYYSTYGDAQWQRVYEYSLSTGLEKPVSPSCYRVTLAANTQDHILYVGETGLSTSYLYYYDTNAGTKLGQSDKVGYGKGKTLYDGEYVYYSGRVYDSTAPTVIENTGLDFIYAKNGIAFSADMLMLVGMDEPISLPMSANLVALSDPGDLFIYNQKNNVVMKYGSSVATSSNISGVADGGSYADQATVTFASGTVYLDNQPIPSGTTITARGYHQLLYFDDNSNCEALWFYIYTSVQSISLSQTELNLDINAKVNLIASVLPADADLQYVMWSSSDDSVAMVSSTGRVVGTGQGDAVITALAGDGEKTATCQVHVSATVVPAIAVQSVALSKKTLQLSAGGMEQLIASITPADADNINATWTSSNEDAVLVDSDGYVYAFAPGTATITVTTEDGNFSDSCQVTVAQPIRGVLLSKHTDTITTGLSDQLSAAVSPSNATNKKLVWSSSDNTVAVVDQNGLVTAIMSGSARITASAQDDPRISDSCQITVPAGILTAISMKSRPTKTAYIEGQSLDLTGVMITLSYNNGTSYDIAVTDDMVSGYDSTTGTKTITVRYGGFSTSFQVTVSTKLLIRIDMQSAPIRTTYIEGQSLDLTGATITLTYSNGTSDVIPVTTFMVSGYDSAPGTKTVTVSYGGFVTSFQITIYAKSPIGIAMGSCPTTTTYLQGESLDLTGATIAISYNNGSSDIVPVTTDMVSGYDSTPGTKTVIVSYRGCTTSFQVTVNSICIVTFHPQGGTVDPTSIKVRQGDACGTLPTPQRTGYIFNGWYFGPSGTGTMLISSTPITETITVYANWTAVYSISGAPNNAAYGTVTGTGSYACASQVTLTAFPNAGYRFVRWLDGSTTVSTNMSYTFIVSQNCELIAEFTKINGVITFDPQGGTVSSTSTTVLIGGTCGTLPTPIRTGYTFAGWFTGKNGRGTPFASNTTVTADTTLYANWTINTYTVTFNPQSNIPITYQSVTYGGLADQPADPTHATYTFTGWYKDAGCMTPWNFAADTVTGNTTLYGGWAAQPSSAYLNGIALSAGELNRSFNPTVTSYTVNLGEDEDAVTISPTKAYDGATMTIDGRAAAMKRVFLATGASTKVTVKVTWNRKTTTYLIAVQRAKSTVNTLAALNASSGTWSQPFDPFVTSYALTLPETMGKITLNPVRPSGMSVVSPAKGSFTLKNGQTVRATFKVKAQSGDIRTYTVLITRAKSTNANLASLKVNVKGMAPGFHSAVTDYAITLPAKTASVTIAPKAADPLSKFTINGAKKASLTMKLANGQTTTVTVTVTAQSGDIKSYTITVSRQ